MNPVDCRALIWVSLLPAHVHTQLAMGPIPDRVHGERDHYPEDVTCRVCIALQDLVFGDDYSWAYLIGTSWQDRVNRTATKLWNWHHCYDIAHVGGRLREPLFDYGNCPEGYRRALVIYRAAGWPG